QEENKRPDRHRAQRLPAGQPWPRQARRPNRSRDAALRAIKTKRVRSNPAHQDQATVDRPAAPKGRRVCLLPQSVTMTEVITSGLPDTAPERPSLRLILSTTSMPSVTTPTTVYWPLRWVAGANMMKNCELALFGSDERAMPITPRSNARSENSAGRSGLSDPPVPARPRSP